MLLADITSITHEDSRPDYAPTAVQFEQLLTEAHTDRVLWGTDRWTTGNMEIVNRDGGKLHSYLMERLARETSPQLVRAVLQERPVGSHNSCKGSGWIQHFSSDYQCSGCWGCSSDSAKAAWAFSRFIWCAGVAPSHREAQKAVAGFEALAVIGAALACLTQWFAAFAAMPTKLWADFNLVRIGNWYTVTGGRGSAAQHKGKVGRCEWRGVSENGYNTPRCALVTTDNERFYVSEGQVSRHLPNEFEQNADRNADRTLRAKQDAQAAYNAAEKCTAGRGGLVVIIAGAHKDKMGEIFWTGEKNGKLRLGVRELGTQSSEKYARRGEVIREPVWIDASEARAIEQLTAEQTEFALIRLDIALIAAETASGAAFSGAHPDFSKAMAALAGGKIVVSKQPRAKRARKAS